MAKESKTKPDIDAAGMVIFGLFHGDFKPEALIAAFDTIEPWSCFNKTDGTIIQYLIEHGTPQSPEAKLQFKQDVGAAGKKRFETINVTMVSGNFGTGALEGFAHSIREDDRKRRARIVLSDTTQALTKANGSGSAEILLQASGKLEELAAKNPAKELAGLSDGDIMQHLDALIGERDGVKLRTGFELFDKYYGFRRGNIITVAGKMASGKTAFVDQAAHYAILNDNARVLFFSELKNFEMILRAALREVQGFTLVQLEALRAPVDDLLDAIRKAGSDETLKRHLESKLKVVREANRKHPEYVAVAEKAREITKRSFRLFPSGGLNALQVLSLARQARAQMGGLDLIIFDHVAASKPIEHVDYINSIPQFYLELQSRVSPALPDCCIVVLQHTNTRMDTAQSGSGDLVVEDTDIKYGGQNYVDQSFVLTRPAQHQRTLKITPELIAQWHKEDPTKFERFLKLGTLHSTKARMAQANRTIGMQFDGKYFRWIETERTAERFW